MKTNKQLLIRFGITAISLYLLLSLWYLQILICHRDFLRTRCYENSKLIGHLLASGANDHRALMRKKVTKMCDVSSIAFRTNKLSCLLQPETYDEIKFSRIMLDAFESTDAEMTQLKKEMWNNASQKN